jgi:hypothetical protein
VGTLFLKFRINSFFEKSTGNPVLLKRGAECLKRGLQPHFLGKRGSRQKFDTNWYQTSFPLVSVGTIWYRENTNQYQPKLLIWGATLPKSNPLLSSSMRQASFKCKTPRLELKSSRIFFMYQTLWGDKSWKVIKISSIYAGGVMDSVTLQQFYKLKWSAEHLFHICINLGTVRIVTVVT